MRLLHYTDEPLKHIVSRPQPEGAQIKPHGLWLSVEGDDDWFSWCATEAFGLRRLALIYEVCLAPDASIVRLKTPAELVAFSECFPNADAPFGGIKEIDLFAIDWPAVARQFQGIIIAPYQWECRLELMWYYGWDCASGCIWDAAAISSFSQLTRTSDLQTTRQSRTG
jgi:hypothetical protein